MSTRRFIEINSAKKLSWVFILTLHRFFHLIIVSTFFLLEEIKGELKRLHIYLCRCNKRLNAKTEGSKLLTYTGFLGGRGYLQVETMLTGERFESGRGECVI